MESEAKKKIMGEAAVSPLLINNAYSTIPTGQTFGNDIDQRVKHYVASASHTSRAASHRLAAPISASQAYHHHEIQQLSDLLTVHTRYRWRDDVFSLADKSVSLQGIYRQSGHIMRSVSRNITQSTLRDCVAFQFARAVHWTAARELERLIGAKSVNLAMGRDVGDLAINRCVMSAHGHDTDARFGIKVPDLPQEKDRVSKVWLHDKEAAKHRILIRGGLLYFETSGQLVDTADDSYRGHGAGIAEGRFREPDLFSAGYVLSLQGALFAGIHGPGNDVVRCMGKDPFFHSSYMAGGDVMCAGRIFVRQGKLVGIDNASGHYRPSAQRLRDAIRELGRQGVEMEDLYCEDISRTNRMSPQGGWAMLWPSANDFLAGNDGAPIDGQWVRANGPRLQRAVADYQASRGMFSKTSTQTQDALGVLAAVQSNPLVSCVAGVWYAFSPATYEDDQRWLKNAKEFVEGQARVRLEPLEEGLAGRFSTQRFKSGLRSKLRQVLPEQLVEIRGVYEI